MLRRDFTVNALAMDGRGEVYDYVGGRKDLKKKRLVTVGDPVRRFQEDALRLFRLCRFAGQLDFTAATETVKPCRPLLIACPDCLSNGSSVNSTA